MTRVCFHVHSKDATIDQNSNGIQLLITDVTLVKNDTNVIIVQRDFTTARAAKIMSELILVKSLSIVPIVISKQVNLAAFTSTDEITVQIEQTSRVLQRPRENQRQENHEFDCQQRKENELRKSKQNQTRKSIYQMTLNNLTV